MICSIQSGEETSLTIPVPDHCALQLCISQLVLRRGQAFLGKVGLIFAVTDFGFGTPVDDVSEDDLRQFVKASNVVSLARVSN